MHPRRRVGVGWAALLLLVTLPMGTLSSLCLAADGYVECGWAPEGCVECPDCCYEDVVVLGTGAWWLDGHYEFGYPCRWLSEERPVFSLRTEFPGYGPSGENVRSSGRIQYRSGMGWEMWADLWVVGEKIAAVSYVNPSCAATPPNTGWLLETGSCHPDFNYYWTTEGLSVPQLKGGCLCRGGTGSSAEPLLAPGPLGSVALLDRGWPEGQEPPVVGEMEVSAIYEAGELVTGCCGTMDDVSYLTLTWYAVTIGEEYDVREPIASEILLAGRDGLFCFEIETTSWASGYYDIRLGAPFAHEQWIRVEVVPPPE